MLYVFVALARNMITHASVQVSRELKFLESFTCVLRRPESGQGAGEIGDTGYFFCFRPDVITKPFSRPKCVNNYWERWGLKSMPVPVAILTPALLL